MKFLIVFFSNTGNTKRVAELLAEKINILGDVKIKNVLTANLEVIDWADVIIIGSPIHGYILFGQKFCSQVLNFIKKTIPENLGGKKVLLFSTYLFSPGKAFNSVENLIHQMNGVLLGNFGNKRGNKSDLVNSISTKLQTVMIN